QWSGFCGNVCPLTIVDPPAFAGRDLSEADLNGVTLWPNPVRDGNVHLMVDGLTEADQRITVDMYDMFGKRVIAQAYENTGEQLNTTLEVDGLAAGVYVVHISTGERSYTERISVQ
ncbi:MAG TPA: T9SS type A sorting domain-containing protein, partial [Flavobacteriales bacterium]|nr:T9SS type A sorting domain-containing protein [Flavobacteriales bacterium]